MSRVARAYHIEHYGTIDGIRIRQHDRPRPGVDQVLVRVRANALNYRDLLVMRGIPVGADLPPGRVPLSDGAGDVVEVGENVTRVRVGERVAAIFRQDWIDGEYRHEGAQTDLGSGIDGMLAEFVIVDEQGLVRLPSHLSYEEGATLPTAGVTAWMAIVGKGRVTVGDTVVLQGSGGVAVFALQFAKCLGARVIMTTSSAEKGERLSALGADEIVNYKTCPDWADEVLRLTDGRGADVVVDSGGGGTLANSCAAARIGGRLVLMGLLAQGEEAGTVSELFYTMFVRDLTVVSVHAGSRTNFEAMNRAIEQHGLRPIIGERFPFGRAPDAYRYLQSQAHLGKVVIGHDG